MSSAFSVLICTYNRHELLNKALEALLQGTQEKPDQVVIVNGGDEHADQVVAAHQMRCPSGTEIKLIKTVNKNLAASRNVGLPHCDGAIVAMTDDDAEVFPDWVTQMKSVHAEHPEAGAVGGRVLGADSHKSLLSRLADIVTFPSSSEARYVSTLPGVNVSYKRSVLDIIGFQDETLFRGEDVDFNWRVQKAGYRIFYHPKIKVWHHHRPTLRQFFRQHYMYGRAYYLVRRKWRDMYCLYPHRFRTVKDFLKAAHFVVSAFYEPLWCSSRLSSWTDRLTALPILFWNSVIWRSGMLYQGFLEWKKARS
jgi:GT2 family glycosyltransferase